jgi:hypothetical protein
MSSYSVPTRRRMAAGGAVRAYLARALGIARGYVYAQMTCHTNMSYLWRADVIRSIGCIIVNNMAYIRQQ